MTSRIFQFMAAGCFVALGLLPGAARTQNATPTATHQVDIERSRVYIRVDKATRLGHSHGISGQLSSGELTFAGRGRLAFDMRTFVADTPQARQAVGLEADFSESDAAKVNANMRGPDCLDIARYPEATLTISAVTPQGKQAAGDPGPYAISGQFTLRGIARPVRIAATLSKGAAGAMALRGSFQVSQADYGIRPFSTLGGLIRLADELTIHGDLVLRPR